jgi:leucyl aminopeptidase (aminopeptidase T)
MNLEKGCAIVWQQCMGLRPGERALIITDEGKLHLGRALYAKARQLGAQAVLIQMPAAKVSGEEPPAAVAAAMLEAEVIVCPTTESMTHTNARINAVKKGARMATMPGITDEMFEAGPITADYAEVERLSRLYAELLTRAKSCRVVTGGRHELILSLAGRKGVVSSGVYREAGSSGNLPSGEAYIAPLEDGADGEFWVDGSIVGLGRLTEPLLITLRRGLIADIAGKEAPLAEKAIPGNTLSRTIGELGIGANPMARLTGVILEDEKIYGSVHVAFGTNISFGGVVKAVSHIDCVTLKPEVYLDERLVIKDGQLLI